MKHNDAVKAGRREFLKGVAVAGGAATVAAAAGVSVAGARDAERKEPEAPKSAGYHVTPHIATYYEKAQF
jgi:hypothetical protein